MCTLAVYRGVSPLYPLIVVANRDEFLGRASAAPARWPELPEVIAGRDLVAGGTWLGARVDGSGLIVGILNRRPAVDKPSIGPGERSRGLLCIETLAAASIDAALSRLDAHAGSRYSGFNLFVADLARAEVLDNGDGVRRTTLDAGLSVLTNLDLNDPRCPRLAGATRRFDAIAPLLREGADTDRLVPALSAVLASHEAGVLSEDDDDPALRAAGGSIAFSKVCVHVRDYGTRSSSMIFIGPGGGVRYFHADGPPCSTAFEELADQQRQDWGPEAAYQRMPRRT